MMSPHAMQLLGLIVILYGIFGFFAVSKTLPPKSAKPRDRRPSRSFVSAIAAFDSPIIVNVSRYDLAKIARLPVPTLSQWDWQGVINTGILTRTEALMLLQLPDTFVSRP